ncbi:MAG: hypothetical protein Q8O35_14420 [Humidesulfovibrio sp.]|jgi:phosphoserine phosphatase|uniref:hypothetical protein n=1 Tax=Humidesulfovibrio sp. TaxID=2910988 RepID=UPI0027345C5B|nr:hypothetical protein [Humidesulfovibrio sp.]MDP2849364.1 hypothetical protein [Humidesulfovibrio sp.]
MSNWEDYSRVYDEKDITQHTIIVQLVSSGFSCGPASANFYFIINDIEALPGFNEALAVLATSDASEGAEGAIEDEITKVMPLQEFLVDEKNQAELLDDYNCLNQPQLPAGFRFKLPGDEALIAAAINAHNQSQF